MAETTAPQQQTLDCPRMSDAAEAAWFGLLRVHGALSKEIDAELTRAHRLPLNAFEALLLVARAEGGRMGMGELAPALRLSLSGLSRLVDRLAEDGLIRREPCAYDARAVDVALTESGMRKLHEAGATHMEVVRRRFLAHFSPAELALLGEFWSRVAPGSGC